MSEAMRAVIAAAEEVLRESIYLGRHEKAQQLSAAIDMVKRNVKLWGKEGANEVLR